MLDTANIPTIIGIYKIYTDFFMDISKKILKLIENQKLKKKDVYHKLGISDDGLNKKLKNGYFTTKEVQLLSELFGVSEAYFFGGEELEMVQVKKIPIRAYAGVLAKGLDNIQVMEQDLEEVELPKKYIKNPQKTLVFEVMGDSMEPEFSAEDLVITEELEEWWVRVRRGKMYVIITNTEILVKIMKSYDNEKVILESRNKSYNDLVVPREEIRHVFKVLGKLKWYE
jgi:phage repressor protein C with HTH and peptisase S24 domain